MTAAGAMGLNALAAFVALFALAAHFSHVFRTAMNANVDYSGWRSWFGVSIPMLLLGATQELMNQLEVLFLGIFAGPSQAAQFAVAWRLASLTPFALAALAAIGAPLVASAYYRGAQAELQHVSRFVARIGLSFAVVVAVGLLVGGNWLLGLFGPGFSDAYPVVVVLLAGGIVNAFTGIVGYLTILTGRERPALVILVGALLLSITLNFLLIPRFGAFGAACASSAVTCSWNLSMLLYVRRMLGIDASAIAKQQQSGSWRKDRS
jgi:O-antigen/teichoic acid export membrane protein